MHEVNFLKIFEAEAKRLMIPFEALNPVMPKVIKITDIFSYTMQ